MLTYNHFRGLKPAQTLSLSHTLTHTHTHTHTSLMFIIVWLICTEQFAYYSKKKNNKASNEWEQREQSIMRHQRGGFSQYACSQGHFTYSNYLLSCNKNCKTTAPQKLTWLEKNKRDVQRPVKPIRKLPPDSRPLLRSEGVLSEIDVST